MAALWGELFRCGAALLRFHGRQQLRHIERARLLDDLPRILALHPFRVVEHRRERLLQAGGIDGAPARVVTLGDMSQRVGRRERERRAGADTSRPAEQSSTDPAEQSAQELATDLLEIPISKIVH